MQTLRKQAVQIISSLAVGDLDVNQCKEKLQALIQQYLRSNSENPIDIDKLIQQVVVTNTESLPNIIIDLLSKRDVQPNYLQLLGQLPVQTVA